MADEMDAHAVESGAHRGQLREDGFALLTFLDHPLQAANLTFYASKPVEHAVYL